MITSSKPQRNPYIIGRPIDQQFFFGRESLFLSINDYLQQGQQVILLYGQRRIGKSSIIRNIPNKLPDLNKFVFVRFNLEYYSQDSLSKILAELAKEVISDLSLDDENIKVPEITELELNTEIFSHEFLPQVYQSLENKNLVLLLDEFDALLNNQDSELLLEQVYKYLLATIKVNRKLFLIVFIEQKSVNNSRISKIFRDVPIKEIGLLDKNSTKDVIIKPAENIIEYEKDAIKAIFNLSAGHPYFTQAICFSIFGRARENNQWKVSSEDVEAITSKAIELAEAGLAWFWDGFSIPEKMVFAAIAEAQENSEDYIELIRRLRPDTDNKLIIETKQLLRNNGFLDEIEEKIKIELVRRWIIQRHPLREEINELDKFEFEQKKNSSDETANQSYQYQVNIITENTEENTDNIRYVPYELNESSNSNSTKLNPIILNLIKIAPIVAVILAIMVAFLYRSTSCLTNEQKVLGIFCTTEQNINISRSNKTFFPNITNIPRDQGIENIKKGNYAQAYELFNQAVKANPYDPEVLIYYNNSLARQQGSPFTLAVVVPVNNINNAQEILRGVAQAQNEFNKNKGFNGRLLEIIIANDSNESEKAKQVAEELVKDPSILGVIGHNSSDATKAALPEYEKAGLAVISPTSTSILLKNPVFFRTVYSDEIAGQKLADYTYKNLQLKKAVVFANPNSPYSNSVRETFTNYFEKLGGEVVRKPLIDLTANTFDAEKEVAKSVYSDKAEAALLFPDTQNTDIAINIAKEIKSRNEKLKNNPQPGQIKELKMLAGHTLYNNETLVRGGKDVQGLVIAVPWFRETAQAKNFAKKSEQFWRGGISWRTATSYDATQALIKALSNDPSRTTVLEGLQNVKLSESDTSGYPLQFTQERERQGEAVLVQIQDGKFVSIDANYLKSPNK
ncbi:MAG: hypothetical protein RLZZ507_3273 [Cyanobacteriota bacterium]|jgi:branched-chain amino acid transport system substrate-binding protein